MAYIFVLTPVVIIFFAFISFILFWFFKASKTAFFCFSAFIMLLAVIVFAFKYWFLFSQSLQHSVIKQFGKTTFDVIKWKLILNK